MLAEKDPAYTAANLTAFSFPAKGLNSIPTILAHLIRKNHESTQPPHYTDTILLFTNIRELTDVAEHTVLSPLGIDVLS